MRTRPKANVVIPDLSILTPREREAWEHRIAGRTAGEAARFMGCSRELVNAMWYLARQRARLGTKTRAAIIAEREEREEATRNTPRCRCGLALPCDSCLPPSAAMWRAYAGGPSQ